MRDRLEKAIEYACDEYTVDDILAEVAEGTMHLWEFENDTFAVTMRVVYPKLVRLRVVLFSGVMDDRVYYRFAEIAKALGATGLECFGRPGWERRLKKFGARPAYTVMIKDLE